MKDGFVTVAVGTPKINVADCLENAKNAREMIKQASRSGVKLMVLPELVLTGYTCGSLFLQPTLLKGAEDALELLLDSMKQSETVFIVGLPMRYNGLLYNCAAVCQKGNILGIVPKQLGMLAERSCFASAPEKTGTITVCGKETLFGANLLFRCRQLPEFVIGAELCLSLWMPTPHTNDLAAAGATVLCNLSASYEEVGKAAKRRSLVANQSGKLAAAYLYATAGEGESTTDFVYSGHDIIAENGTVLAEQRFKSDYIATQIDVGRLDQERRRKQMFAAGTKEEFQIVEFDWTMEQTKLTRGIDTTPFIPKGEALRQETYEEVLMIAAQGLKRRMEHTGAKTAVIGLSGGLDSTLALLMVLRTFDMLGKDRKDVLAVTMPCFGTTGRTKSNAQILAECTGCSFREIPIADTVRSHFKDIGQSMENHDVTFENAQARERTQVLMDLANQTGGMVIGTGDLSELALGWATYNGDHMSMYGVNSSIPKTLIRELVRYAAEKTDDTKFAAALQDVVDTPVSPELLPAQEGKITQVTEDIVGPYELHDFFLYYVVRWGFSPKKIFRLAKAAYGDAYGEMTIIKWLKTFYSRFFSQQFKRNCLPDGPKVGSVSLSPRGDWQMPSDAVQTLWRQELEQIGGR